MANIRSFIENKYEQYYYIVNSTRSLLLYEDLFLCFDKIDNINNIADYIISNKCVYFSKLPYIFQDYIIKFYENYDLGIIINNNNILEIKEDYNDIYCIFNQFFNNCNPPYNHKYIHKHSMIDHLDN
jgi:hypothetical protein